MEGQRWLKAWRPSAPWPRTSAWRRLAVSAPEQPRRWQRLIIRLVFFCWKRSSFPFVVSCRDTVSFRQRIWKNGIKWRRKNPPRHKAPIKTLHSYRNRKPCFDLYSVSGKGFLLVIFEAFWLPLAEQSCRKLRPVSITQQCSHSPPAWRAGVVFQSIHHVQCASAFPRKLERFISKGLFHNKVSTGYMLGKVGSQMAAAQDRLSPIQLSGWPSSEVYGRRGACTPAAQCGDTGGKAGARMRGRT